MLSARRLLNRYGSVGILKIPQGNGVFDPITGEVTVVYDDYDILYVPYPVTSEDLGNFGLSAFDGSFLTFMFKDEDRTTMNIPTTAFIDDIYTNRFDIQRIQRVQQKDKLLAFQAATKVRI